jgi:plastocyanin
MFVNRFGQALMHTGVVVVLLGASPSGPSVTIADSGLTPPEVTVAAGGSVAWTNRGTRQHEITAAGDAFPRFSLAPEGTRSVPFMKPGKYPYLLDGAVKGAVIVVGTGGGRGSGPGGQSAAAGQSPTCRTMADATLTIYRYDVRVAVHRDATHAGTAQQRRRSTGRPAGSRR